MSNIVTTNSNINVVQVTSPGPLGPRGPQGVPGERGTVEANSGFLATPFLSVSGSMSVTGSTTFSGSVVITGSLTVSGSNTFINIGPARFSGSVDISGSLSALTFSGSGAGLTNIPASAISGLNLSRIATGNISASVSTGGTSFTLNNGGSTLFTVNSSGLGTFSNGLTVNGSTGTFNQGLSVSNGATLGGGVTLNGGTIVNTSLSISGTATINGAAILTSATVSSNRITDSNISASVSSTGKAFSVNNGATSLASVDQQGVISGSGLFVSGSAIYIDGPDIRLYGNATLNNAAITTTATTTTDRIQSGTITASVATFGNAFTLQSSNNTVFQVSTNGLATVSSSINIGTPTDGGYSTGFFDTFTNNTKVSDAIDEISAAFLDLAPAKAGTLTGTTLTVSSPSFFSGYLAAGLNSSDWYVDTSAHSLISTLSSTTTATLNTPDTSTRFRAGKNSDRVANTLIGGVSSSKALGSAALTVSSTRALTAGTGSTGTIQITDISQYNTFWAKANARINDTLTVTGSYKYAISSDNGAGTTNTYQMWYVGTSGDYPNQTVTAATPITSSTTFNYLSGISYLKTATFTLGITGSNLFNPVYDQNQISFASSFFSSLSTGSNTPNFNDTLLLNVTRTLTANTNSDQNSPTFTVTATKPGKSSANSGTVTLTAQKVNSYTSAQSINNSNTQTEVFLDEARRYDNLQTTSWDSTATLTDGNLQVQNGRLINGRWGDYNTFVSGSTSASTTYANYFRDSVPGTANRIGGTFTIVRNSNAFASSTPISAWNSGGRLEAVLVLKSDITGPQTANVYYDLGRAIGDNFPASPATPTIVGIRNTITANNSTTYTVTWGLPSGNTGLNGCVIWIRYRNTPNTDYITSLTITYN